MRKLFAVFPIVMVMFMTSCGSSGGKYSDVKKFIDNMLSAQEEYIASVQKAGSADDVVKAVEVFGDRFQNIAKESIVLKEKYPDIAKWDKEPPAELKESFKKIEESNKKFQSIFMNEKIRKFMMDKKVQMAFINLSKKLQNTKLFEK